MRPAGIYALSAPAIRIAARLAEALDKEPWISPDGRPRRSAVIYLPASLAPLAAQGPFITGAPRFFSSLKNLLAEEFAGAWAHIFIGAAGAAVRAIAPLLTHKSKDPPVIVIDPQGRHVISLLSGHWGGANDLASHLAEALNAAPVITTASDAEGGKGALDLLAQKAGLIILDWQRLPAFQGRVLRGETLSLYDPGHLLPRKEWLNPVSLQEAPAGAPLVIADWKRHEAGPDALRLAAPVFALGFGFRKGVAAEELLAAFNAFCGRLGIVPQAIASCASEAGKASDPEARRFAAALGIELLGFPAQSLALVKSPNPSEACGRRFGLPAFSVCEGAAIKAAEPLGAAGLGRADGGAALFAEKMIFDQKITMAAALPNALRPAVLDRGHGGSPAAAKFG